MCRLPCDTPRLLVTQRREKGVIVMELFRSRGMARSLHWSHDGVTGLCGIPRLGGAAVPSDHVRCEVCGECEAARGVVVPGSIVVGRQSGSRWRVMHSNSRSVGLRSDRRVLVVPAAVFHSWFRVVGE